MLSLKQTNQVINFIEANAVYRAVLWTVEVYSRGFLFKDGNGTQILS